MASTEFAHLQILLEDVVKATNNFADENIIGQGGFGRVYIGKLLVSGELVDISARRLDHSSHGHVEFWNEISMLSSLKHANIVSMIGFCDDKREKIIIYHHVANKSLCVYLSDPTLTWSNRLKIAVLAARVIRDIHNDEERSYAVIHRNINSSTILVDSTDWEIKLSGFEYSIKHSRDRMDEALLCEAIGTNGYFDPVIYETGGVTHKSDVYSFGVVLFEILCGRKAFIPKQDNKFRASKAFVPTEDNRFLAQLAKFHYENGSMQDMVPSALLNQMLLLSFESFSRIAYSCLEEDRTKRPDMQEVVKELMLAWGTQLAYEYDGPPQVEEMREDIELINKHFANYLKWLFELPVSSNQLKGSIPNVGITKEDSAMLADMFSVIKLISDQSMSSNPFKVITTWSKIISILWLSVNRTSKVKATWSKQISNLWVFATRSFVDRTTWSRRISSLWVFVTRSSKVNNLEHLRIGLKDIIMATENFSETCMIQESQFSTFYKAELKCFDTEYLSSIEEKTSVELPKRLYTVTIERVKDTLFLPKEHVFHRKVEILRRCKHHNIETLIGFCDEYPQMLLVYEYAQTRSLYEYLKRGILTWEKRLRICLDVACGLNYLHANMEDQRMVIHSDINSFNIVVDENLGAKIDVSGFSVLLSMYQDDAPLDSAIILNAHLDPESKETRKVKRKTDVYSFGVVMLEILCGRSAYDDTEIVHLARRWIDQGIIKEKLCPAIKSDNSENRMFINKGPNVDSFRVFLEVASQCLMETHNERPTMKVVMTKLEEALSFQENHKDTLRMSFEKIKLATQDFSPNNDIGGGGFGRVYRGEVSHVHGNITIVAKRLNTSLGQGEEQFYNELQILYEYKHPNVIGLIGYSNETHERIIVYEHASKGSLDNYLNDVSLTWGKRLQICIDVANGLAFLHKGVRGQNVVIHRDIKTPNILLFDDWKAKVADLGLSLISTINDETDYIIDHVCGTPGYCDPLYGKSGFLTIESDIYSFGVVLFEILCGRSTYAIYKHEKRFLHSLVKDYFKVGKQDEMVFEAIKNQIVPKSLSIFQTIAYRCLHEDREKRPRAEEVLAHLKLALEFQEASGNAYDTGVCLLRQDEMMKEWNQGCNEITIVIE